MTADTVDTVRAGGTGWSLVLPVKPLAVAKSRLAEQMGPFRRELALAFAMDTVAAALSCDEVTRVVVVTDDPVAAEGVVSVGAVVVPDEPDAGLNPALAYGARRALSLPGATAFVAAMSADLPALRAEELGRVLRAAAGAPRAFLADAHGVGTTLLTAARGVSLDPGFGGASRARHAASGAVELMVREVPSVRLDVDTPSDLRAAMALGLGPRSGAVAQGIPALSA